jgi:pyruvate dehydrogenase E2 component (dihydrolipoamide acetyltransferase)
MKTVEMPKMGDTMEEGKILRWLKQVGDPVKKGEPLAEIETDKVNIEVEAFASGVLRKILVPEGDSAPIGASIALVGGADEALPGDNNTPAPVGNAGVEKATDAPKSVPTNGNVAKEASASLVGDGQTQVAYRGAEQGTTAQGVTQGVINQTRTADSDRGRVFISPVARRLAEEHELDYTKIHGTGPNGRIIKMDVEAALTSPAVAPSTQQAIGTPTLPYAETYVEPQAEPEVAVPAPTANVGGDVVEIPLTAMRRTIAKRLSQSMQTAPHFYVTSVIDTGKLAELRKQINEFAAKEPTPIKVSFNDLIVKAVARTLVHMPEVNVSFAEDRLLQKKQVNVGVAVALEQGLIVPVVRNADQRSMLDLARETRRLAEAARQGKLRPEDFSGGTFTVSNLGMFDVDSFTAVINPPESAILAVGSITPTPVVVDGQVVVRDRMKVTLSSDHRAIDGAIAARFLQEVKRLLEEPFGLLV